jgi:hypothetical protein
MSFLTNALLIFLIVKSRVGKFIDAEFTHTLFARSRLTLTQRCRFTSHTARFSYAVRRKPDSRGRNTSPAPELLNIGSRDKKLSEYSIN